MWVNKFTIILVVSLLLRVVAADDAENLRSIKVTGISTNGQLQCEFLSSGGGYCLGTLSIPGIKAVKENDERIAKLLEKAYVGKYLNIKSTNIKENNKDITLFFAYTIEVQERNDGPILSGTPMKIVDLLSVQQHAIESGLFSDETGGELKQTFLQHEEFPTKK